MNINQRIKYFRTEISKNDKGKNYSQRQFAEKLGVSHGVINNIERNLVETKDHIIKLICRTFNVNENSIGISRANLANIETGKVIPTQLMINCISLTYKVNKDWLLDESNEDLSYFKSKTEFSSKNNRKL